MLLMTTAGAAIALAATSADKLSAAEEAPIIVTGTRLPAGAEEVEQRPGGADLVKAAEYQDRQAVSLRDALLFSPGVYAQPRFGQEIRLSIRGSGISRGYHMRGLTLLQDGIPINLADDNGDFQELDPTILEHLEVYRGANAFRFGGTTLGGAINAVTPTGRTRPGVNMRVDGGSFDTVRGLLSYGTTGKGWDGWVAVTGDRSDGDREHAHRDSLRAHGNFGLSLSDTVQTRFYVSAQHIDQELPGALTNDTIFDRPKTGSFFGDQKRDVDSLRLQNRTSAQLGDIALEGGVFLNAKRLFHPIYQVLDQDSLDRGVFARVGWTSGPLELLAGATARFGTVDSERHANVNGKRGALTFEADLKASTVDLYAEGRYQLGKARLILGGIFTHGKREQDQRFPAVVNSSASFDQFSPRLGVLWEPRENLQLYANVSRSHELPGFIELAQVASFVPLDAQHGWTVEVGGRGKIGAASFDVSLYRAAIRNELLQFSVGPDIPASTFNADKTIHQGIEESLEVPLTQWASLRQTYQFNDFRFRNDRQYGDNRLPVIPKHVVRGELRLGPKDWHVTPIVEWVPHGAYADYANSFRVKDYATIGLGAGAAINRHLELFVDARNLTNKRAVGDISAVINYSQQAIFFPVERRAVYAGVRARF
jgi:iron complex outermembrane receptor protein